METRNAREETAAVNGGKETEAVVNGGEETAAVNGREETAAVVNGGEETAAVNGREETAAVNGREETAAVVDGGEETAAVVDGGEETAAVNGREETAAEQKTSMKIWIAVDESDGSFYALQWALEHQFVYHAAATPTADKDPPFTVTVVHVQDTFPPAYTALPVGPILFPKPGMKESVLKAEEESGAKILARASELCDQHKLKAGYLVLKGKPKETLVEAVEQMDVDLLVVGSRGHGHIQRTVLGSISDYCAHHAKCPVLIVRPQKA